jgi:alginate O-acetyltransferase complex protein AlgI
LIVTLTGLLVFIIGAVVYNTILPARLRGWALFVGSVLAIYWLQPLIPLRPLDFALPTATLAIAIAGWLLTRAPGAPESVLFEEGQLRENILTLISLGALIMVIALAGETSGLLPSAPPAIDEVLVALGGLIGIFIVVSPLLTPNPEQPTTQNRAIWAFILLIVGLFAVLKAEALSIGVAGWLRAEAGRPIALAGVIDLGWLGFSYVAFRLIHTLRDRQTGKLPALTLREYVTYLIFFPAYVAGPIDRAERFVKDYRALPTLSRTQASRHVEGVSRIAVGVFKKFVVADSLALFALGPALASDLQGALAFWSALYAFAFRLYFDFSGYSDIAIGVARLYGVNLPENFNAPYLRSNLTAFWQSWHMTLSTWARLYVFTPLSRVLLSRQPKPSPTVVVLLTQIATMVTIGLWHGITLNFVIWGVWHGIGLWVHKLYSDRTRMFYQGLKQKPGLARGVYWGGVLLTFHYVMLGWVWFALPDTAASLRVLRGLVGL